MTVRETKIVVSLFDYTGEALRPWAEQGYDCVALDLQHSPEYDYCGMVGDGRIWYLHWDADVSLPADAARKVIQQVFPSFEWSRSKVKFLFGWPHAMTWLRQVLSTSLPNWRLILTVRSGL